MLFLIGGSGVERILDSGAIFFFSLIEVCSSSCMSDAITVANCEKMKALGRGQIPIEFSQLKEILGIQHQQRFNQHEEFNHKTMSQQCTGKF